MVLERNTLLNNRYRILEILGQGGMGSIYRALDENLGVEVAVKDNLFTTDEYAQQFRREAEILAKLRHANLPRVTDHFVAPGQGQYLVMDYIEGEDLRQRMDRLGTLPEEEVILIGLAVCDALSYLESRKPPVVHRDIKPGNIKITPMGNIFLVDFGLVKQLSDSQVTATGARAMTPGYSPPEQYGTARTDHRSDVFSLGATLYAALTGFVPEDALSRTMEQDSLTPIRNHNPKVSRKMAAVIEKSVEVKPDNRYQTAQDFKEALLSVRTSTRRRDEWIVDPPPAMAAFNGTLNGKAEGSSPDLARKNGETAERLMFPVKPHPGRRKRRIWAIVFLITCIVVGSAGVGWFFGRNSTRMTWSERFTSGIFHLSPTSTDTPGWLAWINRLPFLNANETLAVTSAVASTSTHTPTPTLSPTTALAATSTHTPTAPSLTPTHTPLPSETPTPTETLTPVPTPLGGGGGQIAFASKRKGGVPQIFIVNIDSGQLTQVTDVQEGACQPDWSPDGQRLVFITPCAGNQDLYPGAALFIINADGSGLMPLPSVPGGDFDPAWSPDGKQIAFTSVRNDGRTQIFTLNLDDLTPTLLSIKYGRDRTPDWSPDGKEIIFSSEREGNAQIWVMAADGSNPVKFSKSPDTINVKPSWSPDKSLVLFTQLLAIKGVPRLRYASYTDTYQEYGLQVYLSPIRDAQFSPDGYWVVYEGWPEGSNHDIYIMANNGGGRTVLAQDAAVDFDPTWKPVP